MRQTKGISLKHTLLIICEGEKSEPFFFESLLSLLNETVGKRKFECTIYPFPVGKNDSNEKRYGRSTLDLALKVTDEPLPPIEIEGPQPVCWVNAGVAQLGTFTEVWVVYDQDERTHNSDALKIIRDKRNEGQNIHLAFSSRCFEMYLLEHYEYCYRAFGKSECNVKRKGKTHYLKCMLQDAENGSCQGEKCINGYARSKGYWKYSKDSEVFNIVTNLWYGIYNSHKLKWQSLATENIGKDIYERNPYLNTYRLTLRLIETDILEGGDIVQIDKGNGNLQIMTRENNIIRFENKAVLPLKMDGIFRVYKADKSMKVMDEMLIQTIEMSPLQLNENESFQYDLTEYLGDDLYLKFCWEENEFFYALEDKVPSELNISRFQVS